MRRFKNAVFILFMVILVSIISGCTGSEPGLSESELIALVTDSIEEFLGSGIDIVDISFDDGTLTVKADLVASGWGTIITKEDVVEFYCDGISYNILNQEELDPYWDEIVIEFVDLYTITLTRDDITESGHFFNIPPISFDRGDGAEDGSSIDVVAVVTKCVKDDLAMGEELLSVTYEDREIVITADISGRLWPEDETPQMIGQMRVTSIVDPMLQIEGFDDYWDSIKVVFTGNGEVTLTKENIAEWSQGRYFDIPMDGFS